MNEFWKIYFRDESRSEAEFEAIAVIEHEGYMTGDGDGQGHYVCDVKCSQSSSWLRTNDNMDPLPISIQSVTKNGVVILYKMK